MPAAARATVDLAPGAIVRLRGLGGTWRAIEPCRDNTGRAWWFVPQDQPTSFRARYPEDCLPPPKVKTKRHYQRRQP